MNDEMFLERCRLLSQAVPIPVLVFALAELLWLEACLLAPFPLDLGVHVGVAASSFARTPRFCQAGDEQVSESHHLVRLYLNIPERGGSDVRLDINIPFRPRAGFRYPRDTPSNGARVSGMQPRLFHVPRCRLRCLAANLKHASHRTEI